MIEIKKILIPLNGLDLSEEAIPYGEELAKKAGSELILFHVCEHGHKKIFHAHRQYLERVADVIRQRIEKDSSSTYKTSVNMVHLSGDFIKEICTYVIKENIDLVIMAAYDTDLKEQLLKTTSEKVFRKIACPTLLVRVGDFPHPIARKGVIDKIVVPLDGSEKSEVSLPVAQELARQYEAELALFMMGNKASYEVSKDDLVGERGMDDENIDWVTREKCYRYLEGIENKISSTGLKTSIGVTLGDNPAKEIRAYGKKVDADMVVMATRSKAPDAGWPSDSSAFRLLEIGRLPLLLVNETK